MKRSAGEAGTSTVWAGSPIWCKTRPTAQSAGKVAKTRLTPVLWYVLPSSRAPASRRNAFGNCQDAVHVAQDRLLEMSAPQARALGYISGFSPGEKMKLRRGQMVRSIMTCLHLRFHQPTSARRPSRENMLPARRCAPSPGRGTPETRHTGKLRPYNGRCSPSRGRYVRQGKVLRYTTRSRTAMRRSP